MHFFLQGQCGIGKSRLLQELLRPYQSKLAGYGVQRLYADGTLQGFLAQNIIRGFPLLDADNSPETDNVFLYRGKRDLSVLERLIAEVEQDSLEPGCELVLLDEIGGAELDSAAFMEPLYRILNRGKPCVGVLKSAQNLAHMASRQGLGEGYFEKHRILEHHLRTQGELFTLTEENRECCIQELTAFLQAMDSPQ